MVLRDIFKTQIIEKILYLQPGKLIIIEMSILSNPFYRLNVIALKIHQEIIYLFIQELGKIILKFIWESIGPRIARALLKKMISKENYLTGVRTYFVAIVVQAIVVQATTQFRDGQADQCNTTESSETELYSVGHGCMINSIHSTNGERGLVPT